MAKWPYNTAAWKRLRNAKLHAQPWCEYCLPNKTTIATQVDHRQAIRAGGNPWDWDNLASTCASCHSRKTLYMDGGGGRQRRHAMPVLGCDALGMPLDGAHWWNKNRS